MAKAKRTSLPSVTPEDIEERQDKLRRTANGWAWKCHYCGKFASSETQAGKYVCRDHGGNTPAQRDPVARAEAIERGETPKRPPGRPMTTGMYSRSPGVRIDELVADYQARQLNPDSTDEDMLYLRAYLDEMKGLRPEVEVLREPLQKLGDRLGEMIDEYVPDEGDVTVTAILDMLEKGGEFTVFARTVLLLLAKVEKFSKDLEARHARLINMSKIRSETRLKDAAAQQLDVFTTISRRFMNILSEQLDKDSMAALQKRIERDLSELPARALLPGTMDA